MAVVQHRWGSGVVEIFKTAWLNRPMNTSSLVADFKGHEDQRVIADSKMKYTRATIMDKSVDTFKQNKRFLSASLRKFKKPFFLPIA